MGNSVSGVATALAPQTKRGDLLLLDPTNTGTAATKLKTNLERLIVGQDEAVEQIVNIYQMHLTGLNAPQRPIGNLLFLGPTGSGKTRIVEATSEALLGSSRAVIKIDCAEFQNDHEIAKLTGSPPGYLGHRETHSLLNQETLNQYHTDKVRISFVLFDEIEKASDTLWNLLLGILDKATLTLGDNRKVDFSQTLIFMTSNLGASEISSILSPKLGFHAQSGEAAVLDQKTEERLNRSSIGAARRKFTPEFMNRLDKVVVFKPLGDEQLRRILDIELSFVQRRIFSVPGAFVFTVSNVAKDQLLKQGTDLKYGARHLKRAIERMLVQPLSNLIATEQIQGGDQVAVDCNEGDSVLSFVREAEDLSEEAMVDMAGMHIPSSSFSPAVSLLIATTATTARQQTIRKKATPAEFEFPKEQSALAGFLFECRKSEGLPEQSADFWKDGEKARFLLKNPEYYAQIQEIVSRIGRQVLRVKGGDCWTLARVEGHRWRTVEKILRKKISLFSEECPIEKRETLGGIFESLVSWFYDSFFPQNV